MVIRQDQIAVFDERADAALTGQMVDHLQKFAPKHCEVIGRDNVQLVVNTGIRRARAYGFTVMGPIRFFIESMSMFGSWFDTDPQYPWASEILTSDRYVDQIQRSEALYKRTMAYLDAVAGPNNEYAIAALDRINALRERFEASQPALSEIDPIQVFAKVYPEKTSHIGEQPLRALVQSATSAATTFGATSGKSIALWICMAFAVGHGFMRDPLFPWVASALEEGSGKDPEACATLLYSRASLYLQSAIRYLKGRN